MIVDKNNFPKVCAAFRLVEEDNGGHLIGTVYPGKPLNLDEFVVPVEFVTLLPAAERGLAGLTGEEFEAFVVGEVGEQEDILLTSVDLPFAKQLINAWFNAWPKEDAP